MKTKISKVKTLLGYMAVMLLTLVYGSCSETETVDGSGFALHYYSVTDIGPSVSYTLPEPSYKGGSPSDFAISGITLNGEACEIANFSINAETGAITFTPSQGEKVPTGTYAISVSCYSNGSYYNFKDIIEVNMLLDAPEGVTMTPAEVIVKITEEEWWKASSQLTTETDKHISILSYDIAEGENRDLFTVSESGVVTFNKENKDRIIPGTKYSVSLKLKTKAGDHIYQDAVVFDVISAPYDLVYTPNEVRIENNTSHTSQVPTVKGSEGITFAIQSVEPSTNVFRIDSNTGVISLAEGNGLPIGNTYKVNVTATNQHGSTNFDEVYQVSIIKFINPIDQATFKYTNTQTTYEEKGYTFSKDNGFVGDEVLFSFVETQSTEIQKLIDNNSLTIDIETGLVTLSEDNTLSPDTYDVLVKATNTKGEATATLHLNILANPNKFKVLHYGNNLGLTPAENYASQYEANNSDKLKELILTPKTDLGDRTAKWEMIIKDNQNIKVGNFPALTGAVLDPNTGVIDLSGVTVAPSAVTVGLIVVKATVGEGDLAYSMSVPVFIRTNGGKELLYKPFAVKMNPKTGGRSEAPEHPENKNVADYRADFILQDLTDMVNIKGGMPKDNGSIMNQLWHKFATETGWKFNDGAKKPMSALDTTGGFNNTTGLDKTLGYINQSDLSVVINPEKWIDDNGNYVNGVFVAKICIGDDPATINNATRIVPIAIWFDENFE